MEKIVCKISDLLKFIKSLVFPHFRTIRKDPGKFVLWFLTSVVLSLSTVWIPIILGIVLEKNYFAILLPSNPFIVFSVVFLSSSVLTSVSYTGAGSNQSAVTLRSITLIFTIMYLIFLSSIIPLKIIADISLSPSVQYMLLSITIVLGIYVYGFRDAVWEQSLDDLRKHQEKEIESMKSKASEIQSTKEGVAL